VTKRAAKFGVARAFVTAMLAKESAYAGVREPLNNALRTQRDLKGAAVVFWCDGQGGSLS